MVRTRIVTTPLWSQPHLVRALGELGLAAEEHREPVPLLSWRGLPLGAPANVVVRRARLGSAADDFGFARNPQGTFDAVVSEIHFSRFDRRWLEDVVRRHDALAAADGLRPPAGLALALSAREAEEPASAARAAPGRPPSAPHAAEALPGRELGQARQEAAAALDRLRAAQTRADKPGCALIVFVPLALWMWLASLEPGLRGLPGFLLVVGPLWFAGLIVRTVRAARRAAQAAQALRQRIPSTERARAAALAYLEEKVRPVNAKVEDQVVKDLLKALREPRQ
jgi:hypothetical protein